MFSAKHTMTPIAIVKTNRVEGRTIIESRSVYVFGIRVAYWTCD